MRALFLTGWLLSGWLLALPAQAQPPLSTEQLWQALRQHPQADRQRVDLLNQLADQDLRRTESAAYFTVTWPQVDSLTKLSHALAQQLHYSRGEAYAAYLNPPLVMSARLKREGKELDLLRWLEREEVPQMERSGDKRLLSGALIRVLFADKPDAARLRYLAPMLAAAQASHLPRMVCHAYRAQGFYYRELGDYYRALQGFLQQLRTARQAGLADEATDALQALGSAYVHLGDYQQGVRYYQQTLPYAAQVRPAGYQAIIKKTALAGLGYAYQRAGNDSLALAALHQSLRLRVPHSPEDVEAKIYIAQVYEAQRRPGRLAYLLELRRQALLAKQYGSYDELFLTLGSYYLHAGQVDSALANGQRAQYFAQHGSSDVEDKTAIAGLLAQAYAAHRQYAQAYAYQRRYQGLHDTLSNEQMASRVTALRFDQDLARQRTQITRLTTRQQQAAAAAARQRRWLLAVSGGVALLLLLAAVLYAAFRRSRRLARLVTSQKQDLQTQRDQLATSLAELRTTQAQLIQKEKMASLGELTAGIAHEIQNPLNFVNNFAEVSQELAEELQQELARGALAEAQLLATDLAQNVGKIHQHGQRAAGIVRGMLEHSRASTGERQPTDLNALCDEYLRLAYHGLRAKDQTFNAELRTELAPARPLVEAVPGDLGRVLLNLLTNAFYAVRQRQLAGEAGYSPRVSVSTRQVGQVVEVRVQDNGLGMPESVQAKIFQPFFTTKPTGEGTGLGLSLAHDIVVQGHGGTLTVESQPGQGTTFTITLPAA